MKALRTLNDLQGESPCPLDWDDLTGDDRVRHCGVCDREVLNLSALPREGAERALTDPAVGCVRLLRRSDGTPVHAGPREQPRWAGHLLSGAAGLLLAVAAGCGESPPPPPTDAPDQTTATPPTQPADEKPCKQWMGK